VKLLAVILTLAACGRSASGPAKSPILASTTPLATAGEVGVVTLDGIVFVFDRSKVSVVRGGQIIGHADAPRGNGPQSWDAAAAIPAPDGGSWAVGISGGTLWRVTSSGDVEPVAARLGLGKAHTLSIAGDGTTFAIGLVGGVAIARDAFHVMRFTGPDTPFIAIARDRIAVGHAASVEVFDLGRGSRVSYSIDHVSSVAFLDPTSDHARLVVTVSGGAYVETGTELRRASTPPGLRQLVVSGSRIWMLARDGLFSFEEQAPLRVAAEVNADSRIYSAVAGDVWLTRPHKAGLARYSLDATADHASWQSVVAPAFQRTCAKCHLPGGEADLDLSTPSAWLDRTDSIRHALETRSMPPAGIEIPDADREILVRWISR
jgi:hypothetical protein